MADLSTTYLGLKLPHPLVAGASPLSDDLDGIKRLFSGGNPLQSRLRRGALEFTQSVRPLKRMLMQRALGIAGDVPASVRRPPS